MVKKIMGRGKKLALLKRQSEGAISLFTATIASLERVNAELELVKEDIDVEVSELFATSDAVKLDINQNSKLVTKFKKLVE